MKRLLLTILFVGSLAVSLRAQSVLGRYEVHGKNADGSKYEGTAEIVATSETTCHIVWKTGSPTNTQGICMRKNGVFTAAYKMGDAFGLLIYDVLPDGSMRGIWTVAGESGVGTEVLVPIR